MRLVALEMLVATHMWDFDLSTIDDAQVVHQPQFTGQITWPAYQHGTDSRVICGRMIFLGHFARSISA